MTKTKTKAAAKAGSKKAPAKRAKPKAKATSKAKPKVKAKPKATPKGKAKPKGKKRRRAATEAEIRPLPIQDMDAFGTFVLECILLTLLESHDGTYLPSGQPKVNAEAATKTIAEATGVLGSLLGYLHAHLHHDLGMHTAPPDYFHKELSMAWFRGWRKRCKDCSSLTAAIEGASEGQVKLVQIPTSMRGAVEALISKITGAAAPHADVDADDDPDLSKKPN